MSWPSASYAALKKQMDIRAGQFEKSFDGSRDPIYSYILGHPSERISRFGPKLMVHDSFKDLKMH